MANPQSLGWANHAPSADLGEDGAVDVIGPLGAAIDVPHPPLNESVKLATKDDFDGFTVAVQNQSPNLLLGEDPRRRTATILNTSATPVIVGKRARITAGSGGFVLPQNVPLTFTSKAALYANLMVDDHNAPGTAVIISVMVERD